MEVDKATIKTQNEAQWKEIEYLLSAKRTRPALLWITTNTTYFLRKYYQKCKKAFPQYKHIEIDISEKKIISLNQTLQELLPEEVKKSPEIQHIVHIFGLENSASPLGVTPVIREINHEREMLFREYNCVIMVWSDEILTKKVKEYAPDFWNWASDNFFFEDASFKPVVNSKSIPIIILYVEENAEFKRQLEEELWKYRGKNSHLWFHFENLSLNLGYRGFLNSDIIIPILSNKSLSEVIKYIDFIQKEYPKMFLERLNPKNRVYENIEIAPILWDYCKWETTYLSNSFILPENKIPISQLSHWDKSKIIKEIVSYILDYEKDINYKIIKEQEYQIFKKIEDIASISFQVLAVASSVPIISLLVKREWLFLGLFIILGGILVALLFIAYILFFIFPSLDRKLNHSPQKKLWELFIKNRHNKNG